MGQEGLKLTGIWKLNLRAHENGWGRLLLLVLIVALAIRLQGIRFGLPALNDPDELMFEMGALRMLRGVTLNPGWFGHPATTTMDVLAIVNIAVFGFGHALGRFTGTRDFAQAIYADPSWIILPGRVAMVLFSVAAIWQAARLATGLFDRPTGVATAALLALSPVHITWSQIIRSDMMACFFMLLCLNAALRIAVQDRWRDYVWASLWLGLAIASKWPFALAGFPACGAVVMRVRAEPLLRRRTLIRLVMFLAMAVGFLALASPYLLLAHDVVLRNLHGEAQLHHLGATGGTAWQNAWWYLSGPIWAGLGGIGLLLAAAGSCMVFRRTEVLAIIAPVALGFFAMLCVQRLVWDRWALPLLPLLAIFAAVGLIGACRLLRGRLSSRSSGVAAALIVMTTLAPLAYDAEADASARLNDTRQQASRWAEVHIPAGSTVLIEHFGFDLLPQPWRFLFPLGDAGCVDARAMLQGKIAYSEIEAARGARSNVDYGTVAAPRRASCAADYAILTQYDRYSAEQRTYPVEYGAYRKLIAGGTIVASFAPARGEAAGPIVRVVKFAR